MIIKGVKLHNIRSYIDQSIEFPQGSTLLAGEIGSGKSTILLAIEFALFGITRGVVSGSSLLRTGTNDGSVELHFSIQNKDVVIKRTLKRQKQDVRQHSGHIIINGIKKEATHVELKSIILDLLGYPSQLLTQSKSLIYRYTVYTPQEEMKQILLEKSEYRVDTLRKVFQIDKYKRIRENTQIIIRAIKQQQSRLQGMIDDLDEIQQLLGQTKQEIMQSKQKLEQAVLELKNIETDIKKKQQELRQIQDKIKHLNQLKSNLQVQETKLREKVNQTQRNSIDIIQLEKELVGLTEKSKKIQTIDIKLDEEQLQKQLEKAREEYNKILKNQAKHENSIKQQELIIKQDKQVIENISKLNKCPLCKQDVTHDHILEVKQIQDEKIKKAEQEITISKAELKKLEELQVKTNSLIQELTKKQKHFTELKIIAKEKQNIQNLSLEKSRRKALLKDEVKTLKKEVGEINTAKLEIQKQIDNYENLEKQNENFNKELEEKLDNEKQLTISVTRLKTELLSKQDTQKRIDQEINKKLEAKKRLNKLKQIQNWLQELFINLMTSMENHVMMRVYNEFNEILQQFFEILVETETMSIRLDQDFSPVIEQNGYEVDYEYLSGGEKTSIALAYRLALNKVINHLIENIKTKDLIILDEPTDGFSTQQLDKIRDVLEALNTKQTIIVSHESKIESFVENIIKINKHEHVSHVV